VIRQVEASQREVTTTASRAIDPSEKKRSQPDEAMRPQKVRRMARAPIDWSPGEAVREDPATTLSKEKSSRLRNERHVAEVVVEAPSSNTPHTPISVKMSHRGDIAHVTPSQQAHPRPPLENARHSSGVSASSYGGPRGSLPSAHSLPTESQPRGHGARDPRVSENHHSQGPGMKRLADRWRPGQSTDSPSSRPIRSTFAGETPIPGLNFVNDRRTSMRSTLGTGTPIPGLHMLDDRRTPAHQQTRDNREEVSRGAQHPIVPGNAFAQGLRYEPPRGPRADTRRTSPPRRHAAEPEIPVRRFQYEYGYRRS